MPPPVSILDGLSHEATQLSVLAQLQDAVAVLAGTLSVSDSALALLDGGVKVREVLPLSKQEFDHYQPAGSTNFQIRYIGTATQATLFTDPAWIVQRLTWEHLSDGDHIVEIQILPTVPWGTSTADRDALGWS